jgi:hypothetical protein
MIQNAAGVELAGPEPISVPARCLGSDPIARQKVTYLL